MESRILAAREKVKPLGTHTAVGHLHDFNKWKEIPYLRENGGMLPPFIISVGSRIRAEDAPKMLNLSNPIRIDSFAEQVAGRAAYGRVSLSMGIANFEGFPFPLLIAESQMGCPAAQINLKEILYFSRHDGYVFEGKEIRSDAIRVIRAGTCAGVNSFDPSKHQMQIGDLAIADSSFGSIGALIQSYLGYLHFTSENILHELKGRREHLVGGIKYGVGSTEGWEELQTLSAAFLAQRISEKAKKMGLRHSVGPNFTKDSLYAELGEEEFARLRDAGGVISSEMEQMVIDALASEFSEAGIPVESALIAVVIGAIPGKSFPETEEEKKAVNKSEQNAMLIACNSLGEIARGLNQ